MLLIFLWGIVFYLSAFIFSQFYLFSLGLLPIALYEFFRTEGEKNTKPLSFLTAALLILQFLHTTGFYNFPFSLDQLVSLLPTPLPGRVDPFVFFSVMTLVIFSFLLIRHTWGSITKFLAIVLLAGSLIQAYLFWPDIQAMLNSPQGKKLTENAEEKIIDNLFKRARRELYE